MHTTIENENLRNTFELFLFKAVKRPTHLQVLKSPYLVVFHDVQYTDK